MLSREEARAIYLAGEEAVITALCSFSFHLESITQKTTELEIKIHELESRLNLNSQNSSKPPSSDGLGRQKTQSLREKTGRKPGGQFGHSGHTLHMSEQPDKIVVYKVDCCAKCGKSLKDHLPHNIEKRQVFDVPQPKLEVTEHQSEQKVCTHCGEINRAEFPSDVPASVQYGAGIKALMVYLSVQQLIPFERVSEMAEEIYGCAISPGTITEMVKEAAALAIPVVEEVRQGLINSPVVHCDETGVRIAGKTSWLHSASTGSLTLYHPHAKRGSEGTDAGGVLPNFHGRAVHDFFRSYLKYDCKHSLCNGHLLRELKAIYENDKQKWAKEMADFLVSAKKKVESAPDGVLDRVTQETIENDYWRIVVAGCAQNPPPTSNPHKRGRPSDTKAGNLVRRLLEHKDKILDFTVDPLAPFDNNQAERDIRMVKLHQKISGCFRTFHGAVQFCTLRSLASTLRKNGQRIPAILSALFKGQPVHPVRGLSS